MDYAVFRLTHNGLPEQWLIPVDQLVRYMNISKRRIEIPVQMSEWHGQIYNLAFQRAKPKIRTATGFKDTQSFVFFEPAITLSSTAVAQLIKQWTKLPYVQKIDTAPSRQENLYRL